MTYRAISYTTSELASRGRENLPAELQSHTHLIYSSPAALAFNSPGAEGFGVKRASLAIPGSVMLLVAPGCCGRNTSLVSNLPGYEDRFFYLVMDETDIVTGRHLKKIPQAVEDLCESLPKKPEVVMICITCVDALLGTDMERVCRKAEEKVGIPVRPSYMYALTREGRKPPMVHVRQSLYSLLEPRKKKGSVVNILGFFAPLQGDCELYALLRQIGVKTIHEISRCADYAEYLKMAEANFNLILNPEARAAAADIEKRLHIPPIELRRVYQIDKVRKQYQALGAVLGVKFRDDDYCRGALEVIKSFKENHRDVHVCVGECMNGDPFEMSLALTRYGVIIDEIYGTVTAENFIYVKHLAELSPSTRVYSNLEPTMIYYDEKSCHPNLTIGKDAGYYHPDVPNLAWNSDVQPFGYAGVKKLILDMEKVLAGEHVAANANVLKNETAAVSVNALKKENVFVNAGVLKNENVEKDSIDEVQVSTYDEGVERDLVSEATDSQDSKKAFITASSICPNRFIASYRKGFRKYLTPFAPDQSGAVSVLFELGGVQVICDAGGCVGNICGFDEPRWFRMRSAIFSAGLRDMDAILGRDEKLVAKLVDALGKMDMNFAAIIGTPVPSVIGTDYHALQRMTERKVDIPVLSIDTNGMQLYDAGAEKAYLALLRAYSIPSGHSGMCNETVRNHRQMTESRDNHGENSGIFWEMPTVHHESPIRIGVLGVNPMDMSDVDAGEKIQQLLKVQGWSEVDTYGMNCGLDRIRTAGEANLNLVAAPSGMKAAKLLEKTYGTPYRVWDPLAERRIPEDILHSVGEHDSLEKNSDDESRDDREKHLGADCSAYEGKHAKILIVAQQVTAGTMRMILREHGYVGKITAATWFMKIPELAEEGDTALKEEKQFVQLVEEGGYDIIFADPELQQLIPGYSGRWIELIQFPISGRLVSL